MAETAREIARTSPARICAAQFSSVVVMFERAAIAAKRQMKLGFYPERLLAGPIFAGRNGCGRARAGGSSSIRPAGSPVCSS